MPLHEPTFYETAMLYGLIALGILAVARVASHLFVRK